MKKSAEILSWIGNRIGKPPGWERFVRIFASPGKCREMQDICVARDGSVFIAQPSVPLGWHVTFFGSYEPELRDIFRTVLPTGGVAMDIGANVGWHTLLMARAVGDKGRIFAAEANPSVRKRLAENLAINRYSQVEILPYAMADREDRIGFYGPPAEEAGSGDGHVVAVLEPEQKGIIFVETRCIDTVASDNRIERLDLLKIDVEGYEWPVLKGAEQTISRYRPHIIFEYNTEYASRGSGSPDLLVKFFQDHRYRLFVVGQNGAVAMESDNWPKCADIWAVPLV